MSYYHPYEHRPYKRMIYNNPVRVDPYPQSRWIRGPSDEDDNNSFRRNIERQSRMRKVLKCLNRSSTGRALPMLPEPRHFSWMVNCIHLPEDCHATESQSKAPWTVLLRFMFVDIRQQLKDRSASSVYNWRNYKTQPLVDHKVPPCYGKPGRRFLFSQDGFENSHRMLKGDWLVAAYVWGESHEWLDSVDVAKLISWGSVKSIRAYRPDSDENNSSTCSAPGVDQRKTSESTLCQAWRSPAPVDFYQIFYDFERQNIGAPFRFLFARPPGYTGSTPLAIMFGTPVSFRLQDLCSLMDTSLKVLLRNDHETRSSGEEDTEIQHLYGSSTQQPLWALGQP